MTTKIIDNTTRWPRFSAYVIHGERLVPAPGAELEWYDPWEAYAQASGKNREDPPYLSLVQFGNRIRLELETHFRTDLLNAIHELIRADLDLKIPQTAKNLLLECSRQHGLLGLFHHETVHLEWGESNWAWADGDWIESRPFWGRGPKDKLFAVIRDYRADRKDAQAHLENFLGLDLPKEMPSPRSDAFWKMYGEPVTVWLLVASEFASAVLGSDFDTLDQFARRAVRIRRTDGTRVNTVTAFPSILSSFAEMYFQDQDLGKVVGICDLCGDAFTSDRSWTKYCGPKCATKARQKRFKDRKPDYYSKSRS